MRCDGFTSSDGRYAHCSREEYAGALRADRNGRTYPHRLDGLCRCGVAHLGDAGRKGARLPGQARQPQPAKGARTAKPMRHEAIPDALTIAGVVYTCSALYPYRTAAGEPWAFEVRRYDTTVTPPGAPGHTKTYRPYTRRADGLWVMGQVGEWPLYHLPHLRAALASAPDAPVLIVEGEKCADLTQAALRNAGLPWAVTTTPGGAGQAQALPAAMFAPLAGRRVVIIPDHDEAGERYAAAVAQHARAANAARVATLRLAGLSAKEDVAEWLARQPGQVGHDGN